MSNLLQSYIDPQSTNQLLNNLSLAIDETKLILKITSLSNYLNNLESFGKNDSKRSEYIRNEM